MSLNITNVKQTPLTLQVKIERKPTEKGNYSAMAEAAVSFLIENLKYVIVSYAEKLTKGDEVVRWIEYEFETLIPHLERFEAIAISDELPGKIRDIIRRAEDLAGTHTKLKIRMGAATFNKAIYQVNLFTTSIKLHGVKEEISDCRRKLLDKFEKLRDDEENSDCRSELLEKSEKLQLRDPPPPVETQTVPSYLRRHAFYLLLFPPNQQVPARRLIVLWVAEGLVHPNKHDDKSAEQIARGYLNELMNVGLVEEKRRGKLTCSIDPKRRDKLMEEAHKDGFLEAKEGDDVHRLVDHNGASDGRKAFVKIQRKSTSSMSIKNYRYAISFLSFNTQEGSKPGEDIGDFLQKCISAGCFLSLRVLDLECVFRPKLPETLGRLIAMKYLGLRWTYLEQLPNSVEKLFNLQVLDVKHTYISVLPRSIWRMQFLTHLYLSEAYRTRFPHPPSKVTLTALETLWGAFVDEETPIQGALDTLFNIRKLGLSCRSTTSKQSEAGVKMLEQLKAINKWISNLEFLESLRLKSRDEDNIAVDLHLTSLKENRRLSMVYLLGKLESILLCRLPASLTNVTLSGSDLQLDPLEFLGRLPNLTILRLLGHSVQSSQMYCSKRSFPRLKLLWIWKLEKLKDFHVEEGSLPCLEELEIRECQNLEALPSQLGSSQMYCSNRAFPQLKILRISKLQKLKNFGLLPWLEELEIRECQNLEALPSPKRSSQMYCSERPFPYLKVLRIMKLEKLKDLHVEDGSLPCLEELEIRDCPNIEALPGPQRSSQMYCSESAFSHLKVLRIMELEKLRDLHVDDGSLPCLEELEIRDCPNIEALSGPLGSSQMYFSKRALRYLKALRISKLEKLKDFHVENGSLPCLEELEIRDCPNLEALLGPLGSSQMYCSEGALRYLKVLRISKLEKLKNFLVEEGALPYLKELEIRDCQNMEALPRPLLHIRKLKIKLTNMPQKIGKEARSLNPNVNIIEQKLALE
ncbi:probable disease resistance protein RF9 [Salvia hispanica]|uniref:probable disease resistance protein RF9 n=1 Tax=Salvia hispanica TaxID=49212 RepID=UPI0020098F03|nr:probable disease resistance protein RF9 [Salvia hispanica]